LTILGDHPEIAVRVATAIEASGNPEQDIPLIMAFVRTFDPGGVVREGDVTLIQSATTRIRQYMVQINRYLSGQAQILDPGIRAAMRDAVIEEGIRRMNEFSTNSQQFIEQVQRLVPEGFPIDSLFINPYQQLQSMPDIPGLGGGRVDNPFSLVGTQL
jgi:hypothetical protein